MYAQRKHKYLARRDQLQYTKIFLNSGSFEKTKIICYFSTIFGPNYQDFFKPTYLVSTYTLNICLKILLFASDYLSFYKVKSGAQTPINNVVRVPILRALLIGC